MHYAYLDLSLTKHSVGDLMVCPKPEANRYADESWSFVLQMVACYHIMSLLLASLLVNALNCHQHSVE